MTDGTAPESEHDQQKNSEAFRTESGDPDSHISWKTDIEPGDESTAETEHETADSAEAEEAPSDDAGASGEIEVSEPRQPTSNPDPEPPSSDAPVNVNPEEEPKKTRVNPFSGATQFFSVRGFLAASSLFLLTLIVCLLAVDLVWALAIALLFTVAISTGHLVFYTRDRQVRERVYFSIVAIGAFCGGALVVDLQLTLPYFIELREFNQATQTLKEKLDDDERFAHVKLSTELKSTELKKIRVASFTGTVQKRHHLRALELLAEEAGFAVGENEVTVLEESAAPEEKPSTDDDEPTE